MERPKTAKEIRHLVTLGSSGDGKKGRGNPPITRYYSDPFYDYSAPTNRKERRAFKALKTHNRKAAKRGAQR